MLEDDTGTGEEVEIAAALLGTVGSIEFSVDTELPLG